MQLGKLLGWTLAATGCTGLTTSHLFHIRDNMSFLIGTGSEVSVIPPAPTDRGRSPDPLPLTAINNTQHSLTLNLGLRRSLPWIFIIADVQKPILGADFLSHYGH